MPRRTRARPGSPRCSAPTGSTSPCRTSALLNGLEGNYDPASPPRIETIARVAERAGLNVIDLYRGARFNEWTIEQAREALRRGFPVLTLVQGSVLPGGTPPGAAREQFITVVGREGDDFIYHDPAYADEGTGAFRRVPARVLEQAWLAASIPRLGAALSRGAESSGLLDSGRAQEGTPGPAAQVGTPAPATSPGATVPVIATIAPTPTPADTGNPFGLPVHPLLILFWAILVLLLLALLLRGLR